ncbi:MAG: hypothetical protein HUU35_13525 [Armatimonadetes bacterium]|nr:hypothetical protein [Armatimonadota bacterium]
MSHDARVEWLQEVVALLDAQQSAVAANNAEAFIAATEQLEQQLSRTPQSLDSPSPLERAWLRGLRRASRDQERLLETLLEPLLELDQYARRHDLAVALDCQA